MSIAFIFPGQGSQKPGMGVELAKAFAPARELFAQIDETLSTPLSRLMRDGPETELQLTQNAQPAIMAVSMAVMRVLRMEFGFDCSGIEFLAGHSLGEYSAHCTAGVFSLADTATLLRRRGQAMQQAVPAGQGSMAALLGANMELATTAIEAGSRHGICSIANDNAPGQIVISGDKSAVDAAIKAAHEAGLRKAVKLPVSAPFHCPLMQPASTAMAQKLDEIRPKTPQIPVISNVTARPISGGDDISELLCQQITGRVRWRESIEWLAQNGVDIFVEAGHGSVLSGLNRRIVPSAKSVPLGTPAQIEQFIADYDKQQ